MTTTTLLIDARSFAAQAPILRQELQNTKLFGFDIETQDENRHAGLESFNNKKRHVFDHRRTVITGFSIHCDGSANSWYVNAAHADEQNRLSHDQVLEIMSWMPDDAVMLCHNAPFELVMVEQCWDIKLRNVLCTMQLAVTHHGPDEYDWEEFRKAPLSGFYPLARTAATEFTQYDRNSLTSSQAEVLGQFISKTSDARHSYNGFVKSIAYGYGLKQLVKRIFGYDMTTYEQVLGKKKHMGELTGEEVAAYGADDAFWVVPLFKWLRDDLLNTNPLALQTFIETENKMVQVYADNWRQGIRLDLDQVFERQRTERHEYADVLRKTKQAIAALLPFPEGKNEKLAAKQDWYEKHWETKRGQIEQWTLEADSEDDFEQCRQFSNPIGNAWANELGVKLPDGRLNLTHYYAMRTILYDLLGHRLMYVDGKVGSDADVRGRMVLNYEKTGEEKHLTVLRCLQEMADIEQRMKLYLTPYTQLMDPETSHVYPSLSSRLATRRMGMSFPNGMQLAKRGSSTYIRGFYLADNEESVLVSADWSSVELVLIGDTSGDPEFHKVFGQLPYGDLHSGAAADGLAVKHHPGLTVEEFSQFKFGNNPNNRRLVHPTTGAELDPKTFFKVTRTDVGKASNFNYFYSGALSTVGTVLGWTSEQMWEAVDRYRQRFAVAEEWRVNLQQEAVENGFVTLPDGHRRMRPEATIEWFGEMRAKMLSLNATQGMENFADLALRRIQSRAKNQIVNSMIQGTCATLAKRSILRLQQLVKEASIDHLVRFILPVHDELIFSVHKSVVLKFIPLLRKAMTEHPTIMKTLPLDCTVAIGRTFEPFDFANPKRTQIELDEAFVIDGVVGKEFEGKALNDDQIESVLDYIFSEAA